MLLLTLPVWAGGIMMVGGGVATGVDRTVTNCSYYVGGAPDATYFTMHIYNSSNSLVASTDQTATGGAGTGWRASTLSGGYTLTEGARYRVAILANATLDIGTGDYTATGSWDFRMPADTWSTPNSTIAPTTDSSSYYGIPNLRCSNSGGTTLLGYETTSASHVGIGGSHLIYYGAGYVAP